MLVDFSDGMKLDGEPNPILVDLSDEKKQLWMFTLASFYSEQWLLDGGLILSLLNAGRSLNGDLINLGGTKTNVGGLQ